YSVSRRYSTSLANRPCLSEQRSSSSRARGDSASQSLRSTSETLSRLVNNDWVEGDALSRAGTRCDPEPLDGKIAVFMSRSRDPGMQSWLIVEHRFYFDLEQRLRGHY